MKSKFRILFINTAVALVLLSMCGIALASESTYGKITRGMWYDDSFMGMDEIFNSYPYPNTYYFYVNEVNEFDIEDIKLAPKTPFLI
ncbi:MAG: hypothetical protein JXA98_06490 [Methanosarcinaceae archaeon]|nr:hypothetical protein [Methanosarcinaceae archaeon]